MKWLAAAAVVWLLAAVPCAGCAGGIPGSVMKDAEAVVVGSVAQGSLKAGQTRWHRIDVTPGSVSLILMAGGDTPAAEPIEGHFGVYNPEGWQVLSEPIRRDQREYRLGFLVAEPAALYVRLIADRGNGPYTLGYRLSPRR